MDIAPTVVYNYCRVSTKQQGNFGLSLAEQEDRCATYCQERGWRVSEVIREVGSAYSKHLKKLGDLLKRAEPGSMIIVTSYDRFSRNVIRGTAAIADLAQRRIRVFSLQEQQDTLTAVGRYTFQITVAAGEFNSANTGAKVAATFAKQKREGIEFGAARYGQSIVKEVGENGRLLKRKRVPNDQENTVIELMRGLRNGITAKRATTLMNKVVEPCNRAPVEFLDGEDKVISKVNARALNGTDIASLLNEYSVPYRGGKQWHSGAVLRILHQEEAELEELGVSMVNM